MLGSYENGRGPVFEPVWSLRRRPHYLPPLEPGFPTLLRRGQLGDQEALPCALHVSGGGAATPTPGGVLRGEQLLCLLSPRLTTTHHPPPAPVMLCVNCWPGGGSCCDWATAAVACQPPVRFTLRTNRAPANEKHTAASGVAPHLLSRFFLLFSCCAWARPGPGPAEVPSPKIQLHSTFSGSTLKNIKDLSKSSLPGGEEAAACLV